LWLRISVESPTAFALFASQPVLSAVEGCEIPASCLRVKSMRARRVSRPHPRARARTRVCMSPARLHARVAANFGNFRGLAKNAWHRQLRQLSERANPIRRSFSSSIPPETDDRIPTHPTPPDSATPGAGIAAVTAKIGEVWVSGDRLSGDSARIAPTCASLHPMESNPPRAGRRSPAATSSPCSLSRACGRGG
jgi:hypothetical protein